MIFFITKPSLENKTNRVYPIKYTNNDISVQSIGGDSNLDEEQKSNVNIEIHMSQNAWKTHREESKVSK